MPPSNASVSSPSSFVLLLDLRRLPRDDAHARKPGDPLLQVHAHASTRDARALGPASARTSHDLARYASLAAATLICYKKTHRLALPYNAVPKNATEKVNDGGSRRTEERGGRRVVSMPAGLEELWPIARHMNPDIERWLRF